MDRLMFAPCSHGPGLLAWLEEALRRRRRLEYQPKAHFRPHRPVGSISEARAPGHPPPRCTQEGVPARLKDQSRDRLPNPGFGRTVTGMVMSLPRPRLIARFDLSERIAHWLLASTFASMLATGVFMGGIGPLGHHDLLIAHVASAIALLGGIAAMVGVRRSRRVLARTVRDLQPIDANDRNWLRQAPLAYVAGRELPRAGRFNAGQKVNARLVLVVLLTLFLSGAGELSRYVTLFQPLGFLGGIHTLAAIGASALVAVHIYLATINPATRPSLRGITLGTVDRNWAAKHHEDWVASVEQEELATLADRNSHALNDPNGTQ
jgi:formate dehydrogenase subunit gamma